MVRRHVGTAAVWCGRSARTSATYVCMYNMRIHPWSGLSQGLSVAVAVTVLLTRLGPIDMLLCTIVVFWVNS